MAKQNLVQRSAGRLVRDRDPAMRLTGRMVCVSCFHWNCWHRKGQMCDVRGCECSAGNDY